AIRKSFNTFRHFKIFKVAERFMKVPGLLSGGLHEAAYLFGGKTYSPEDAVVALVLERVVKQPQAFSIFERTQFLPLTGTNKSHRLGKRLHDQAGPITLFSKRSGIAIYVLEAILVMLGGELPDGSVVEDCATRQHI